MQSLARHVLADMWLQIEVWLQRHYPRWHVVMQVHDELVLTGPEGDAESVKAGVLTIMSTPPRWWPDLPVAAEAAIGMSYGEAK